jgi:hypothetical protein
MPEARAGSPGAAAGRTGRWAAGPRGDGSATGGAARPGAAPDPGADAGVAPEGRGHVCPVAFCPVGMALTFAEASRPEVVQHLMAAGQELLLAVKAIIDARAEAAQRGSGLERIAIT